MRHQVTVTAGRLAGGALPHHDVWLAVGWARRVDARLVRAVAERVHLHARRAALRAHARLAVDGLDATLGQRIRHVAVGPAHAAGKAPACLGRGLHNQVAATLGTHANLGVGSHGVGDGLGEVVLVVDKAVHHTCEKRARMVDNLRLCVGTLGNLGHVTLELGGHLGRGDARGVAGKRVDDGHAKLTGLGRVVLEVLHVVEALDDRGARGLGAQSALLHLLDELALAVARRWLGLLGVKRHGRNVAHVALVELGQLVVLLEAVGVDGTKSRHGQDVARGNEGLAGNVQLDLGASNGCRPHKRGQEATRDEVVELPLGRLQVVRVGSARGVDGRVVGGLLLAARGMERVLAEKCLARGRKLRHRGERPHALA